MFQFLGAAVIFTGGCLVFTPSGGDTAPQQGAASARELGPLPFLDVILGRDGGYSIGYHGESLWNFGDTLLARAGVDGSAWRTSTWSHTADTDASDGIGPFVEPTDRLGVPGEFLPFTAGEAAFNAAHRGDACTIDCGARVALWPAQMVIDLAADHLLVFYGKFIARPGDFNFVQVGWSIAVWDGASTPVRPLLRPDTADPTLMFQNGEPFFGSAAVTVGADVYAYGCETDYLSTPCRVARIPAQSLLDRSAWTFYAGDGRWSPDLQEARPVLDGAPMMSVQWNAYLNQYIAIHNDFVTNRVVMNTADRPEGPWSGAVLLFTGIAPDDPKKWDYGAMAHPEFEQQQGQVEYITYFRPTRTGGEMRLVQVTFAEHSPEKSSRDDKPPSAYSTGPRLIR